MLRQSSFALYAVACLFTTHACAADASARPNVLFLAVDDLNDWVGPLKGHWAASTPNFDRLARRGTTFLNAHCQSPLCNPSRTSVLVGLRPTSTGIYGLVPTFRAVDEFKDRITLPEYFHRNGYRTYGAGKIFHGPNTNEFDVTGPRSSVGVRPGRKLVSGLEHELVDWGVFPHRDDEKGDYHVASWAADQLRTMPRDKPFFLAAGFFLPHVPCYATQPWFDLYPDDDRILPEIRDDDRADTPRFSWYLHWKLPEPRLKWVRDNHQWRNLVRSYLACISFVDAQIGRVLDALDESGLGESTVVVLWSDHGWHLGEKAVTGKNTLWERSTRVPLIFAGPGISKGVCCTQPAELLDMYPTLVELCGLPARADLEGISLLPQLADPNRVRERPAITSHNQGNHAVRTARWRYIRYADGSAELYNLQDDPQEWTNLIDVPDHAEIVRDLCRWLPAVDRPPAPGSAHRVLTYDRATDIAVWEGETVRRTSPIPE
ncbi:MAG: sulfatase [Planctomycetaceae bacterium]